MNAEPAPPPSPKVIPLPRLMMLMPIGADRPRGLTAYLFRAQGEMDAHVLSSLIFDVRRRRPLVVMTPTGPHHRHLINPGSLAMQLWTTADVVTVMDTSTTQALCALLPDWLMVYNSGVRIYRPGADVSDPRTRHPLIISSRDEPDIATSKIIRTVRHSTTDDAVDPVVAMAQLRNDNERLQAELSRARQDLNEARHHAGRSNTDVPVVYSDPTEQVEHEIWLSWMENTPEVDRDRWPLREYTLGKEFLDSMDSIIDLVSRRRIIRCAVDVITGRYAEKDGRSAKRHKANGTKEVTREDGAVFWRCSIQNVGPGAPRMMWWECPGNEVQLSRVAHHDDFRIS